MDSIRIIKPAAVLDLRDLWVENNSTVPTSKLEQQFAEIEITAKDPPVVLHEPIKTKQLNASQIANDVYSHTPNIGSTPSGPPNYEDVTDEFPSQKQKLEDFENQKRDIKEMSRKFPELYGHLIDDVKSIDDKKPYEVNKMWEEMDDILNKAQKHSLVMTGFGVLTDIIEGVVTSYVPASKLNGYSVACQKNKEINEAVDKVAAKYLPDSIRKIEPEWLLLGGMIGAAVKVHKLNSEGEAVLNNIENLNNGHHRDNSSQHHNTYQRL